MALKNSEEREAISWNIVAQNSDFVSLLLRRATTYGLKGNLNGKFFVLQAVRDNINFSLKEKEREKVDDIESDFARICQKLRILSNVLNNKNSYKMNMINFNKELSKLQMDKIKLIKNYHHLLMDFLEILGYFPKRENRENMSF